MNDVPLIILGSGRSGTTWVLDALAKANNLRTIFEPLNPIGVAGAEQFSNKYVKSELVNLELKLFMDKIFAGDLKNLWANFRIRSDRIALNNLFKNDSIKHNIGGLKYWYNRLFIHYLKYRHQIKHNHIIVKFIRANLMAGWFLKQYKAKIIFIMRHPCAVVASKLQLGGHAWAHETILRQYLEDKNLESDYLYKYKRIISYETLSPVEAHTVIWCIENMMPLHAVVENDLCLVFYENLILNGQSEWQRVTNFAGLHNTPGNEMLRQPSQQASIEMKTKKNNQDLISKWQKKLNKHEINEVENILRLFEVPYYNAFDFKPIKASFV